MRLSHIDIITKASKPMKEFQTRRSPFSQDTLRAVPEVRIFGATDMGQRVVAHVHGTFPYVFIEYKGKLDPDSLNAYMLRLGKALNRALEHSLPTRKFNKDQTPQFVAFIVPCKGVPFYGYHVGYRTYLKVYAVDPKHKKRMADILRSGALMDTKFEVFEDHISFLLQFMLDQNLYGCGWVEIGECLFRKPLPAHRALESDQYNPPSCAGRFSARIYDVDTVPRERTHGPSGPDKASYCALELDLNVEAILNRTTTPPRNLHQDFYELGHPSTGPPEKLVTSVKELWDDERRRREARGESGPDEVVESWSQRDWDSRDPNVSIWQSEDAFRKKLDELAKTDGQAYSTRAGGSATKRPEFATFVDETRKAKNVDKRWLDQIRTTFEQVDATYPGRMERDEKEGYFFTAWAVKGIGLDIKPQVGKSPTAKGKERAVSVASDEDFDAVAWNAAARSRGASKAAESGSDQDDQEGEEDSAPPPPTQAQAALRAETRLKREQRMARVLGEDDDGEADEVDDFKSQIGDSDSADDFDPDSPDEAVLKDVVEPDNPPEDETDDDGSDDEPAAKRVKRALSVTKSPSTAPPTPRPPPPPLVSPRKRNPFASPTKGPRVKFAVDVRPDLAVSDDEYQEPSMPLLEMRDAPEPSSSSSQPAAPSRNPPPAKPPSAPTAHDTFSDLPSDFFDDDYQPTPTVHDPGPESVPLHLRLFVGIENTSSDSPTPEPIQHSIESSENSTPQIVDPSSTAESTSTIDVPLPALTLPPPTGLTPLSNGSSNSTSLPRRRLSKHPLSKNAYVWAADPPTTLELESTIARKVVYQQAYYSNPKDVPKHAKEYAGRSFKPPGDKIKDAPEFRHHGKPDVVVTAEPVSGDQRRTNRKWEWAAVPPTWKDTQSWLAAENSSRKVYAAAAPQIEGPTQAPKFIPVKGAQSHHEKQHMSLLTMELQVNTRKSKEGVNLRPDPNHDAIVAIFYCYQSENDDLEPNGRGDDRVVGVIAVGDDSFKRRLGPTPYHVEVVADESELFLTFIAKVQNEWDPEIVAGYEVHYASWGYLIERGRAELFRHKAMDIVDDLGRMRTDGTGRFGNKDTDRWGFNETSTLNFTGRHVISIWRVLKGDNKFLQNSFEHVVINILRRRTPHFTFETLTRWCTSDTPHHVARVFAYWINRVEMDVELLEENEDISKNCEFARIYGVDFRSVRLRGSQFKVEAVMFRIAKPESFLLLSPTRSEVGHQNAAECQPLIMEPKSGLYTSPLIVLDFQSLYPSVMIAYNLCYSTCIGRVGTFKGTSKLGTTIYDADPGLLALLRDKLIITPNGMAFVPASVRKSLLAKMLTELLDSRVMVKGGMKGAGGDKALLRLLNGRQLALKLLANVTYGYTSATFSGRMPCVEIADAIVQTGRETLERAIETVRSNAAWGAEVVYGDTDSLFIYLPGRSKEEAFKIGHEIADKVTSQNPRPIKLKFEKVYLPSCLLAKKRYVGHSYETEKVVEPAFDAKGIETVRRDGFMASQKVLETSIKTLFRTADLSQVKAYVQRQWTKLLDGDVSPQDFTFAKAVKLGTYSDKRAPPPGATVAERLRRADPRAETSYGERVPYLLFATESKTRQIDRALTPEEFLSDPNIRLDADYYINAMIKALNRIFLHIGVDVTTWYADMPKKKRLLAPSSAAATGKKALLDEHFASDRCLACDGPNGKEGLCSTCLSKPGEVLYSIKARERAATSRQIALHTICASCEGTPQAEGIECASFDCPTFYSRKKSMVEMKRTEILVEKVEGLLM
ncbi:hypothetical protein RQP46_005444 [Phenoliferia psychrophenolica]